MRQINARLFALTTLVLVTIASVAGCGKGMPGATTSTPVVTPTAVFKAYYEAVKANNAEAVKRLFSKDTLKLLEDEAKQSNKTPDEVFKEEMEEANKEVPATLPEVRNEKIEGDTATIEARDDKTGKWETFHLVKEDGEWKVSFSK